jgi:vitamin B12 transporter
MDYRNQKTDQSNLAFFKDFYSPQVVDTFRSSMGSDSAKVRQFAGYASFLLKDLGGFNLELGSRYNSFNKYGNVFTYSINPSYVIDDQVKLFANLSSGFSAPTLYQLYSEYRNPAGNLKPEKTLSLETGIQYSLQHFNARAVYFQRATKDNIIFYTDASYKSYYLNQDKQNDYGVELEASLKAGAWSFSGNYTYVTGKVTTQVDGKDTSFYNLYRRPKNTVNLSAGLQATKALFLSLALRTAGKRIEYVYGGAPSVGAAYYTLDGYMEYKICKQLKAFADLKNLTDQQFFDIPGYNSKKFNFMAGISLHL